MVQGYPQKNSENSAGWHTAQIVVGCDTFPYIQKKKQQQHLSGNPRSSFR